MARVNVRFFDDETLEGEVGELDFDQPDFVLDVDDASGLENNEKAWVPLSAVKWVSLAPRGPNGSEREPRKVAIRFIDGEVMRAHMDGDVERHRYGIVVNLRPEPPLASPGHAAGDGLTPSRLAIPFSAIKALFYVRHFDGREEEDQGTPSRDYIARRTIAPLIDVLEEMGMLDKLHQGGVLSDAEYQAKRTQVLERL
jgi:hypothetical protein